MAEIIVRQSELFVISMFYGVILGVWYDFFRAARKQISHKNKIVHMEDVIFCISAAAGLFLLFQIYNQGRVRFYVLLGLFVGAILYFFLLSALVEKGFALLMGILFRVLGKAGKGVGLPVKLIVNYLVKSLKKIFRTAKIIKSRK